jgi:hypothetical protein
VFLNVDWFIPTTEDQSYGNKIGHPLQWTRDSGTSGGGWAGGGGRGVGDAATSSISMP